MGIREWIIRAGARISRFLLYDVCGPERLDPDATYWNRFRRRSIGLTSTLLGPVLHTDREIRDAEFAGTLDYPPGTVEEMLWEAGFHRNPIAAVKTRDGTPEVGSWVKRDSPDARRQLHVMLFRAESSAGTDVYAHEEFSCLNGDVAVRHYEGTDQQAAYGVELVCEVLPFEEERTET